MIAEFLSRFAISSSRERACERGATNDGAGKGSKILDRERARGGERASEITIPKRGGELVSVKQGWNKVPDAIRTSPLQSNSHVRCNFAPGANKTSPMAPGQTGGLPTKYKIQRGRGGG